METTVSTKTIVDHQDRSRLAEGRSRGMGYAFLKKTGEDCFETVQPISPCKDYLNDVVFSEATGKPCRAYGLSYQKQDIFSEGAFLALSMCAGDRNYEEKKALLHDNQAGLLAFIHGVEELLQLEERTELETVSNNLYLVRLPLYWVRYTYLISLYSLLLRTAIYYTGGDLLAWLRAYQREAEDAYMLKDAVAKLEKLIAGAAPVQDWERLQGGTDVHNLGIMSFRF